MSLKTFKVPAENEGFDLTPMIDVVFLLIVFFMTVASMLAAEKIEMNLAVAEESSIPREIRDRFTFSVTNDGTLFVGANAVSEEEFAASLARLRANVANVRLVLRADRDTEHRHVNRVLEMAAEQGITDIIFATYQSEI